MAKYWIRVLFQRGESTQTSFEPARAPSNHSVTTDTVGNLEIRIRSGAHFPRRSRSEAHSTVMSDIFVNFRFRVVVWAAPCATPLDDVLPDKVDRRGELATFVLQLDHRAPDSDAIP